MAYGKISHAWRFEYCIAYGYNDNTGYLYMPVMASAARALVL